MKIRCSKLPLAMACPASLDTGEYEIATISEPSRYGTAAHAVLGPMIDPGHIPEDFIETMAVKYSLDADELTALVYKALRLWNEVAEEFPEPRVEVYSEHGILTGHRDVTAYNIRRRMLMIADHKTGYLDGDHLDQLKGYGWLGLQEWKTVDEVFLIQMNVRHFTRDQYQFTRQDLDHWYEYVQERLIGQEGTYNPGKHCAHCPRWATCPAYRDYAKQAIDVLQNYVTLPLASPAVIYDAVAIVKKLHEVSHDILRDHVIRNNGCVPYSDKYNLQIISEVHQSVNGKALPILREHLPDDQIAGLIKFRKKEMQQAIKDQFGRGQKGKALEGIMTQMDEVGALDATTVEKMVLRKKEVADEQGMIET